ncbi:OFA family MFS transporter [Quadrisphaera sp. DSM 44207]|uniref:L-lactate MFS transporter n=1 Tax=Quadrisphaera sp. DSM 44207 TaxID=1881057 RepID=UPI00088E7E83|nr:OFA family MFS transporter [Quadrisphaera sp. DSM 44207]SDQ11512.1 Nitrate/nitrite transporter NarK [Quadrisphaera sp. DSM 44207]
MSFLDRERTVAPPGYSRWLIPPAALAVHLSIGQVYAFSVFNAPLEARFGTSATAIATIFSISIVMLGLSAAFGGTWVERNGPRKAMALSATCWVTGFLVAALGVSTNQLWLVYLGYGVIGGIGLGIGYISPVSTLIKWFPDRPGLATGIAIMGFGGGALLASPLSNQLLARYASQPIGETTPPTDAIVPTFLTLAAIYAVMMALGAWVIRVPAANWRPDGWVPSEHTSALRTNANVSAANAIKTPQFWLLWTVLFCNVTAGIGILAQAAPMIQGFFAEIDAASAAGYVGVLSLCNMAGRIVWSSTSDIIGRKNIYIVYLGVGALLYLAVVLVGQASTVLFVALTGVILSFYGGGFATIPAYLKDLFGGYQVGAIHGRLLTAWSAAGVAGPLIVSAILDARRGAGYEGPSLYTLSLSIMVGVLVVGFLANLLVRPVDPRFHEENRSAAGRADLAAAGGERSTR